MSLHVVIGSGPIGSTVARLLADEGEQVRVVTRSGTGPEHHNIERVVVVCSVPVFKLDKFFGNHRPYLPQASWYAAESAAGQLEGGIAGWEAAR